MAIEIVDFPIKNCDFPWQNVCSPEGIIKNEMEYYMNISLKAMSFFRSYTCLYHPVLVKFIGLSISHIAVVILPAGWTLSSGL